MRSLKNAVRSSVIVCLEKESIVSNYPCLEEKMALTHCNRLDLAAIDPHTLFSTNRDIANADYPLETNL